MIQRNVIHRLLSAFRRKDGPEPKLLLYYRGERLVAKLYVGRKAVYQASYDELGRCTEIQGALP